jgi:predicted TIM-barrel fold metal-dependent hydrolase
MKIDIFAHILTNKYLQKIERNIPASVFKPFQSTYRPFPAIANLDARFKIMDKQNEYTQILTLTVPFLESFTEPRTTVELVKIGNDEMAELVTKYPDRFSAAVANLPMNDIDASLRELDRVITKLHFKGIQLCTDVNGKPLDSPEFLPFFEKMEKYDLPIWLHPTRGSQVADYASEETSKYKLHHIFGWPYDTSVMMVRLVLSHILEKYPKLKLITHHLGAMIPFFDKRLLSFLRGGDMEQYTKGLSHPPMDYFKKFYADTALQGSVAGLMCGYAFFGADHMLFGTDMPYGSHDGELTVVDETIESIDKMNIPQAEKNKIFSDNAIKLLNLKTR